VTALERFRDALTAHDCSPRGTAARCPAHDDRAASLSIGAAKQFAGLLVKCHAGCSVDDILTELGLTRSDLFDEPRQAKQGNAVVAEYRYVDENNQVLYIKQRRYPKDFRQYVPLPNGGKDWKLSGVRRVLYQLPEVLAAVKAGETIYIAEGEKDVHELQQAGVVATTWTEGAWAPGSSPKWKLEYSQQLTGADVIIVQDRDHAGRNTANHIAKRLQQHAAKVGIVEAAEGKDAADHFAAGKGLGDFVPCQLDEPREEPEPEPYDDGRPRADVRNAAHAADWLRLELGRGQLSGIFRRDDLLVHTPRIGEEGYLPPQDLGLIDAGPAQVRPIPTIGVKSLIETRYQCWRTTTVREGGENTEIEVAALFPQQSAQSACEAARLGEYAPNLKTLHGVTHTPMMRPDGTILDTPGYDAATGFLYLPDPDLTVPPIPERPTPDQIKAAVDLILMPVAEFPFVSEDDRATWIGLAFTPALRPLLPGPYQMGVITATNPGSGKTLLAKMIRILHGGAQRGEMPRDADELRKSITAALMDTTAPVITFDNLTGVIRSSVLESLLTTKTWTDRWLGQNRSVTATNDRLWLATGNNAQFGGDLARRITTVELNPPGANHHLRTDFTIKNLEAWMWEHRGKLLAAILTIARGWVVAGTPSETARSDDYAPWVGGLRGMLGWAGFPGVFGGSNSEVALSTDDEEWHAFLVALHDAFSAEPFTVKDLVGELRGPFSGGRIDAAALPGDLAEKWSHIRDGRDEGFRKSLGWWLRNRLGRYASGWAVVGAEPDTKAGVARYAVKPPGHSVTNASQDAGHAPEDQESAGFRGFTGFNPATREKENGHLGNTARGNRPGENPQNPETPPAGYDFAKAMSQLSSDVPTCWQCGRELVWTDEQRSGVCSRCDPEANLWREEEATP
jgi:hypothetical protein